MNFKLSKETERDLENIWLYTHENWSIEQAERYLNLIFDEIDYLCLKPKTGFEFGNIREGYWRSKVKSHYIYYKINLKENELEIIRILHEMMHVENQLVRFILSVLDGTGIVIDVPQSVFCDLIKKHLPTCPSYQLDELIITILKAVCDLQTQIDTINSKITALNADYTIGCLTGVTASSDTHEVLQATINKLCSVSTGLTALILNVNTNYVKIADINTYIANYLASIAPANRAYTRMVPYVPMPYVGALSGFPAPADQLSATGQGVGYWEKVYLCNGLNGTPDLRGRMTVGAISGVGGGPLNSAVDPANPLNTNFYNVTTTVSNCITL
jgi:toxin ParE1/3/4